MCPAAGYAFFGGARGPRPTGRYVEPRVGDGVPQWSTAEQMPLGYDVPSARQRRAERRIPTPVTAGHAGPALQGAAVIQGGQNRPPLFIRPAVFSPPCPGGWRRAALSGRGRRPHSRWRRSGSGRTPGAAMWRWALRCAGSPPPACPAPCRA